MKSIASIHKRSNGTFEIYSLLEKRFYPVVPNNLSLFKFDTGKNYILNYKVNNDQVIIDRLSNLEDETDLLFLMSFLNHSKGELWTWLFERTGHLIEETDFVSTNVFTNSYGNLNEYQKKHLLNSIDLNYLFQFEKVIRNDLELVFERILNQKDLTAIPQHLLGDFKSYISKELTLLTGFDIQELFRFKEIIPDEYLFDRLIHDETETRVLQDKHLTGFVVETVNGNKARFKKLLISKFPVEEIFPFLNDERKFNYLNFVGVDRLKELKLINDYIALIQNNLRFCDLVPKEFYRIVKVLDEMPPKLVFQYQINKDQESAVMAFFRLDEKDKDLVINQLPMEFFVKYPEYIERAEERLKKEIYFEFYEEIWGAIPREIKIQITLDIIKKGQSGKKLLRTFLRKREKDPLVNILLFIILKEEKLIKYNLNSNEKIDIGIRKYFEDETLNILNLKKQNTLLPTCRYGQTYFCEVKTVNKKDGKEYTYCPRLGGSCHLEITQAYTKKESKDWGLFEIFFKYNIQLEPSDLKNPKEYINKLSGYVNRLIELEERMICRTCNSRLISNNKYSKFLARYNMTVARCVNPTHEQVYFNHCWNCTEIIDSRGSQKIDGYYLCVNCGAGPRKSSQKYIEPGSLCPKCRHNHFHSVTDSYRIHECIKCGHRILKPKKVKTTDIY